MQESKVFGRKLVSLLATAGSDGGAVVQVRRSEKRRRLYERNKRVGLNQRRELRSSTGIKRRSEAVEVDPFE